MGRLVEAQIVWMDERPLDPRRVYLLKHAARVVSAELDTTLALNDIGLVRVNASRRSSSIRYEENRTTGSFVVIDPATNATAGAGMIVRGLVVRARRAPVACGGRRPAGARRAHAATEAEAVEAVQRMLEEILA
jgi:sulfate adenylyltransferase subunit 1 (EFTu-like GTPase family)